MLLQFSHMGGGACRDHLGKSPLLHWRVSKRQTAARCKVEPNFSSADLLVGKNSGKFGCTLKNRCSTFTSDEEINVTDRVLFAAITSRDFNASHIRQSLEKSLELTHERLC